MAIIFRTNLFLKKFRHHFKKYIKAYFLFSARHSVIQIPEKGNVIIRKKNVFLIMNISVTWGKKRNFHDREKKTIIRKISYKEKKAATYKSRKYKKKSQKTIQLDI